MFARKLTALEYPQTSLNIKDETEVRNLILWLEDQKIRHYKIEDREGLRRVDCPDWPQAFAKYLGDLASPVRSSDLAEQLEWLLSLSVRVEYADNVEKYNNQTLEKLKKPELTAPKVVSSNPLDNLDFESPDFKEGVKALAQLLKVSQHPDHLVTLKAVSKVVSERLSADALENPDRVVVKGKPFPFGEADLGFDTGDRVLNQACKVLRLLYIHDLRRLQTRINESIVAAQTVTADPKTDTKISLSSTLRLPSFEGGKVQEAGGAQPCESCGDDEQPPLVVGAQLPALYRDVRPQAQHAAPAHQSAAQTVLNRRRHLADRRIRSPKMAQQRAKTVHTSGSNGIHSSALEFFAFGEANKFEGAIYICKYFKRDKNLRYLPLNFMS